ncbi:MAG: twin-arginine translocase subunit TatC [Bacteroidales bacterium]|nr:twin-arginine translocase subunit TatC [Bacteroidales bacterium]
MAVQSQEMTFWDHVEDLRKCIIRVAVVFLTVTVVLFCFKDFLFDDVVLAPSDSSFWLYRLFGLDFSMSLVNIEVSAQFMIHMKLTFICSLILCFPYIIYELWCFIAPALYEREKTSVRKAFAFASVLFYCGLAVGYYIIFPLMLNFFAGYQVSPLVPNTFSLSSYISLFTSTIMTFGLVFEFPTVIAILSALGIVTRDMLQTYRRHAVCAVVILAALITPSGDPFSLFIVTIPLYLLYEFSIVICRKADPALVNTLEDDID